MTPAESQSPVPPALPDLLTLIAVSCLAYIIEVALHEHGGHALACVLLNGHPQEMGAFYVDCDYSRVSTLGVRLVALAGPVVSLLVGLTGFAVLRRLPVTATPARYFAWLIGSLGLMSSSGYLLFSGVAGIGDLGTTADGVFYRVEPQWLCRAGLTAAGAWTYWLVIKHMRQTLLPQPVGAALAKQARRVTLVSYLSGAIVYAAIGLLNPHGFAIMAMSVLPSSLGGTCGLLVMWNGFRASAPQTSADPSLQQGLHQGLDFGRNVVWISVALAVTIAYAAVFGPTLRP
ncbi:MAG: hypothetical protein JO269_11285 [Burkholderiaceae bacterium]|nr:hypothetical protein [Burkholderiaceae bacterium]